MTTSGSKMISRRQIIREQHELPQQQQAQTMSSSSSGQQSNPSSNKSSSSSGASSSNGRLANMAPSRTQLQAKQQQQQQQLMKSRKLPGNMMTGRSASNKMMKDAELQQQQDSSDGYIAATHYDDYPATTARHEQVNGQSSGYRHFDPYSIYSEEDDVWYSEERLFEVSLMKNCFIENCFFPLLWLCAATTTTNCSLLSSLAGF